jgi:hypothetical protein
MTLLIAYILNIIDYLFTSYWVSLYGIGIEGNPIGRWMFNYNVAWVFKIIIVGGLFLLLGCLFKRYPKYKWIAYIPVAVYAVTVIYHIVITITVYF